MTTPQAVIHVHEPHGRRLATLLNATSVKRSWVLGEPGKLQFDLPRNDPLVNPTVFHLFNWVVVGNNWGGPTWVGHLARPFKQHGNVVSVEVVGVEDVLARRYTDQQQVYDAPDTAGEMVRDLVEVAANLEYHTGIDWGKAYDLGPAFSMKFNRTSVLAAIRQIADTCGYDWWVEPYKVKPDEVRVRLYWASFRGTDQSHRVILDEINCDDVEVTIDPTGFATSVTVVGAPDSGAPAWTDRVYVLHSGYDMSRDEGGASTSKSRFNPFSREYPSIPEAPAKVSPGMAVRPNPAKDDYPGHERRGFLQRQIFYQDAGWQVAEWLLRKMDHPRELITALVAWKPGSDLWRRLDIGNIVRCRFPSYFANLVDGGVDVKARVVGLEVNEAVGVLVPTLEVWYGQW